MDFFVPMVGIGKEMKWSGDGFIVASFVFVEPGTFVRIQSFDARSQGELPASDLFNVWVTMTAQLVHLEDLDARRRILCEAVLERILREAGMPP